MRRLSMSLLALVISLPVLASASFALNVGSDGGSGALTATNTPIDLSLATTGDLSDPGRPNGTFDPVRWAVIFKYASVTVPNGIQVTFKNHPSGAPVVWLVQNDVTLVGTGQILLNGQPENTNQLNSPGGPGGFSGGRGDQTGKTAGGLGPGGGARGAGGSYATLGGNASSGTYGNPGILPLIGGSGGGAYPSGNDVRSGTGGGGAILIAANGTVTLGSANCIQASAVTASFGAGSGGAVRILANSITGSGSIIAAGGASSLGWNGGYGRIRLEANSITVPPAGTPAYSSVAPLTGNELIFPAVTSPTIRVSTVGGQAVSATPNGELSPIPDVTLSTALPVTVELVSANVPANATVTLRVVPVAGTPTTYNATSTGTNTWQVANVALPSSGVAQMQARAVLP